MQFRIIMTIGIGLLVGLLVAGYVRAYGSAQDKADELQQRYDQCMKEAQTAPDPLIASARNYCKQVYGGKQ